MPKPEQARVSGHRFACAVPRDMASFGRRTVAREREALRRAHVERATLAEERSVFSMELVHRVRNDLQLVYSAVCAGAKHARNTEYAARFDEVGRQVMSMTTLYNHLLGTGMAATVDFGEYLELLCAKIGAAEAFPARHLHIYTELESLPLELETAVVLGTVLNELVVNAAKHAFDDGAGGMITVRLVAGIHGGGSGVLSIADDGRGLGVASDRSHGLELVRKLLRQIGCHLTHDDQGRGTAWRIHLP